MALAGVSRSSRPQSIVSPALALAFQTKRHHLLSSRIRRRVCARLTVLPTRTASQMMTPRVALVSPVPCRQGRAHSVAGECVFAKMTWTPLLVGSRFPRSAIAPTRPTDAAIFPVAVEAIEEVQSKRCQALVESGTSRVGSGSLGRVDFASAVGTASVPVRAVGKSPCRKLKAIAGCQFSSFTLLPLQSPAVSPP